MNEDSSNETLLTFPCPFAIKVMGKADVIEFDLLVIEIIRRHVDALEPGAVTSRHSKAGNYLAVTVTITATSKPQLDAIYQDLTDHPHILMAL